MTWRYPAVKVMPATRWSGSGLGLTIVKSVAQQHGAFIRLNAADDEQGLLVEVRFPWAPA